MAARISTAGWERLCSQVVNIAKALLPTDTRWPQEGAELRPSGTGGLSINVTNGAWFVHTTRKYGRSPIGLIELLKSCSRDEALDWAASWLGSHPDFGTVGGVDDEEIVYDKVELAEEIGRRLVPATGTPAELYLRSRGIAGDILDYLVKYLPNARPGEGALVGILASGDRVTGYQVGYVDAAGNKTTVKPFRRRYNLEKFPGAVFAIPAPNDNVPDFIADTAICEGLEDALTIAELGRQWRIEGVPGIGALQHRQMRKKHERILVVRDGDAPGSGGSRGLTASLDYLLLEGATIGVTDTEPYTIVRDGAVVSVTDAPAGEDANSILQKGGAEALSRLIDTRKPAALSIDGEFAQLSRLSSVDYDRVRRAAAKRLNIRMETLDGAVAACRPKAAAAGGAATGRGATALIPEIEPWPDAVDGSVLLGNLAPTIRKYIILHSHQADAMALWAVYTHLADRFDVAPKLILTSAQKRSGKSRTSGVVARATAKPLMASSITGAAFARVIDRYAPTLFIDEFDKLMGGDAEISSMLHGLLNASFDRAHAFRIVMEKGPDGEPVERILSTFCPQVLSGIGNDKISDQVSDRSVIIELQRKKRSETVERLRKRDGADLRILASQAARFAVDYGNEVENAEPAIPPELNDRAADAWAPLLAIADVAGGEWPERARAAARKLSGDDSESASTATLETNLLSDIRDCFVSWKQDHKDGRLASTDIVSFLVGLEERPWGEIKRGRPLTKIHLARLLRPFHISPSTVKIGSGASAYTVKGYHFRQFKDDFERYLFSTPSNSADSTVTPSPPQGFRGEQADFANVTEDAGDVSKTHQVASVSEAGDEVTDELSKMEGGPEKKVGEADILRSNDASDGLRPNGPDTSSEAITKPVYPKITRPTKRGPRTPQEQDIVDFDRDNPGHPIAEIAKMIGQPSKLVAELLGRPA